MVGIMRANQGDLKAGADATDAAHNAIAAHIGGVRQSKEEARTRWQGQGSDAMYAAATLWIEKASALNHSLLEFSSALKRSDANSGDAESVNSAAFLKIKNLMTGGAAR